MGQDGATTQTVASTSFTSPPLLQVLWYVRTDASPSDSATSPYFSDDGVVLKWKET